MSERRGEPGRVGREISPIDRHGPRAYLRALWDAALDGVDPDRAVRSALTRPDVERRLAGARRVGVFAVGKAAAPMARAAVKTLGRVPRLVVLPRGQSRAGRLSPDWIRFASHPEPDASSVRAAREAVRFFRGFGDGDAIVCLVSGGASSLLALPRPGVTLARKRRAVRDLAASGAPIEKINRLRTSLSAVKGGRLGRMTAATLVNLVISDVAGDDPAVVGSGPTIRGRRSDVVHVVASNRDGVEAAAAAALSMGLEPWIEPGRLAGDARAAGRRLARQALALPPGAVLLAGGETTVALRGRAARGGRCLELALAAAEALRGSSGVLLLAAGSDGVDGTSGAAGAFAGSDTMDRALARGLDWSADASHADARSLFLALGDLFVTGATGTNVADWVFAIRVARAPARSEPGTTPRRRISRR
jgi:glycerate 2-kinase